MRFSQLFKSREGEIKITRMTTASGPDDAISTNLPKKRRSFKVIVLGDSGVGKTSLTYRFTSGSFPSDVDSTIGVDFREKLLLVDGEEIRLQLWDTAGQERFRKSMISRYYRKADAVVLVYDVANRESFDPGLERWIRECENHGITPQELPMIVLGNKVDLQVSSAVPTLEAQRYADEQLMPHFETSAKDDSQVDHVEAVFMTLAHKLKHRRSGPMFPSSSPKARSEIKILFKNDKHTEESYNCCYLV